MGRVTLCLLLGVATFVGCENEAPQSSPDAVAPLAEVGVPESPKELTLYSGRSEALVAPLIEKFEKQAGIEVKVKYGKTGELAGALLEEGDASPADVFWAQDAGTLGVLTANGKLAALPQDVTAMVSEPFRSPGNEWVATSGRARVLVYNTTKLKPEDLPADVEGLTDAKWKGRVGWAPENASFQAFVAAKIQLEGAEATDKWLAAMTANEPKTYPKNTPAVAATGAGEVDVALVNHYYLFRLKAEKGDEFPVQNHFFKNDKAESLVNVAGVALVKTTDTKELGEQFVKFLLSEESQKYFSSETHEYPVAAGVAAREGLPALDSLKTPKVDFSKVGDLKETVALLRKSKALP